METIIVFLSRHGCSEKAAHLLADQLVGEAVIKNLKKDKVELKKFRSVIIGGSIHAGKVQNGIKKFCQNNMDLLLKMKIGLYLCCMETGETAEKQFNEAFPKNLRDHAVAKGLFGGEFNLERMSFFEKKIVEKVAKITESISQLDEDAIREFVEKFR